MKKKSGWSWSRLPDTLPPHAPTQRALNQTLRIAVRLHRGDPVYEAEAV